MSNNELRQAIVDEARSWIGTSFMHQGRCRMTNENQGGCDCIGLVMQVAKALSLKSKTGELLHSFDQKSYGRIPQGNRLSELCKAHLLPVDKGKILTGDIVLLRFKKYPQHVAFYADDRGFPSLIHSYQQASYVVESRLESYWKLRIINVFKLSSFSH